jgi:hypothetical protein
MDYTIMKRIVNGLPEVFLKKVLTVNGISFMIKTINDTTFTKPPFFTKGGTRMYNNLIAEMARNRMQRDVISKVIGKSYNQTREKINGKAPFTYDEALTIQETLFPDLDLKYLFKR